VRRPLPMDLRSQSGLLSRRHFSILEFWSYPPPVTVLRKRRRERTYGRVCVRVAEKGLTGAGFEGLLVRAVMIGVKGESEQFSVVSDQL
jgi:hypothetical protein